MREKLIGTLEGCPRHAIRADILVRFNLQDRGKTESRPVDAALDRPDGATADFSGFFIREAGGAHQQKRLSLIVREFRERGAEILEVEF